MRWNTSNCHDTGPVLSGAEARYSKPAEAACFRSCEPAGARGHAILDTNLCSRVLPARWPEHPGASWRCRGAKEAVEHSLRRIGQPPKVGADSLRGLS